MTVPLHALLVGVARYASHDIADLSGPVNDVRDLERALVDDLGIPRDQVRTLTDDQATRAAIEEVFTDHLIGAADAWRAAGAVHPPPAFLFAFSGHGSQALDPSGVESDGFEETLVPHDGRADDIYDVKDHELAAWLARLPGDNVTVILDCCHSGSGTRRPPPPPGGWRGPPPPDVVRAAPPDLRPQPPRPQAGMAARSGRVATRSVHEAAGSHVLLAACRDHEQAFEHRGEDGRVRGALTAFLVPTLTGLVRRGGATYRELHRAVRFEVTRVRPLQSPLCEGDLDRELLSDQRHDHAAPACVLGVRGGRVWFDVGLVHGVGVGTRLATVARDGTPVVVAVDVVEPVRSAGPMGPAADVPATRPAPGTVADVQSWALGPVRWRLLADAEVADHLADAVEDGPLTGLVDLVADEAAADLICTTTASGITVRDASGRDLVEVAGAEELVPALAHVARFVSLLGLERADLGPELPTSNELRLGRLVTDRVTGERTVLDLPRDTDEVVVEHGDRVVVELSHDASEAPLHVYASILSLTDDWEVALLHPTTPGSEDRLAPGRRIRVGFGDDAITATVPAGREDSVALVRAVVTTHPTSLESLVTTRPAGRWGVAGPLPVPRDGRPTPPEEELLTGPDGALASRWLTRSRRLVTRRPVAPEPDTEPDREPLPSGPDDQEEARSPGCGPT